MKRLAAVLAVATLLVAAPLTHFALAKKPAKVDICHVNAANDVFFFEGELFGFGKIISVSPNAVAAHEAHGDSQFFFEVDQEIRDEIEELFGIDLPNADCAFPLEI